MKVIKHYCLLIFTGYLQGQLQIQLWFAGRSEMHMKSSEKQSDNKQRV